MERARINLFQDYRNAASDIEDFDEVYPSYVIWDSKNFNNEKSVKDIWSYSLTSKNKKGYPFWSDTLTEFYKTFVCDDKSWAKKTTYCGSSGGGGNTTTSSWDNFPCVVELAKSKGISKKSNNSYVIGNFIYYPNGRKGIISTGGKTNFTCNDPEFKKSNSGGSTGGGSSVSQGWLADPTGSKKYVYQLRDCKWFAKNTTTNKEFNISDDSKYNSSVQILNKTYSDLVKNCNKSNTQQTPGQTTAADGGNVSNVTKVNLPGWASCLKSIKNVKITQDDKGDEIVTFPFGKDNGYFWKEGKFLYVKTSKNEKTYGKWSCTNNSVTVKTDDNMIWTTNSGWRAQVSSSVNPEQNFKTTEVSADDYSMTEEEQPKPNPINLNQKESYMNNLENVINEVNDLISEQTQEIIQAPKDELLKLQNDPFLKAKGTLVALCRSKNLTSLPVNVNNKIYFAAKKVNKKGTKDVAYITYDGMVLEKIGESCNFKYATNEKGEARHIDAVAYQDLSLPYTEVLTQFGINPKDYNSDPYFTINSISKDLQNLVKQGAVSTVFKSWNDMLTYYHPNDYATFALTPIDGKSLTPPTNRGELSQYRVLNGRNYGLKYNDKDVVIYMPATASPQVSGGGKKQFDETKCKEAITEYLGAAVRYESGQDPSANPTINNSDNRTFIKGCYGANKYSGLTITQNDLPDVSPDTKIFKWFRGKTLSIKEVSYLLSGKDKNLPSGKNPYLPFPIRKNDMNESKVKLDTLIKENLQQLAEQKNKNLLAETKIIQTRTKILTENRILKFKQPREKFFNEIISEAIYLESQGFDKQIIKEEFWDTLKGMFGQHGSEAIFGTFKEYMGKWLLQKLTPVNPNGWIGSIVVTAIGNLHIDDISKLTDCSFLTKKLASSIGEGIARKIQHDKGYDGGISDIVRNGLFSAIDNSEMVKSLENGLSSLICPALSGVKNKLESKADEMKLKAVRP
jgi:hypothetical protein